jgi:hypothetical protein
MGRLPGMRDEPIDPGTARSGGHGPAPAEIVYGLPADAAAPAIARAVLVEHAGSLPAGLIEDALLLVSELVTNAVQHGQPEILLSIRRRPPGIGVSVQDRGRGRSRRRAGSWIRAQPTDGGCASSMPCRRVGSGGGRPAAWQDRLARTRLAPDCAEKAAWRLDGRPHAPRHAAAPWHDPACCRGDVITRAVAMLSEDESG